MLPWVISRATGLVAFALIAGAMVAGLLVKTRSPVASVKGSGTDTGTTPVLMLYAGAVAAAAALTGWRAFTARRPAARKAPARQTPRMDDAASPRPDGAPA